MAVKLEAKIKFVEPYSFSDQTLGIRITSARDSLLVEMKDSVIDVQVAKRPGKPWGFKEDVERARVSYKKIWGDVPTWDNYDRLNSTFNYIAYVHYQDLGRGIITEALSNRMVLHNPEDLTFYHVDGVPLKSALTDYLYKSKGASPKIIAGESRIGAIRPLNSKTNDKTLKAFAAIKLKMVEDTRAHDIEYICCQLKPEMTSNVLSVNGIAYDFPPTENLLELPYGSIKLNRNNPEVAWHILNFPGYFLQAEGVYKSIKQLIEDKELSKHEFSKATGLSEVEELLNPRNIKELLPFINTKSPLGASLRVKLLKDVPDGTYSSISHVDDIEKRALRILKEIASLKH